MIEFARFAENGTITAGPIEDYSEVQGITDDSRLWPYIVEWMGSGGSVSEYEAPEAALFDPIISTVAQARLSVADENIEVMGGGAGGIAGAFALSPGLAYVQFTKDQGTTDYVVQAFDGGLFRCYVPNEEQYSDGFVVVSTDLEGAPAFPQCITVIVTRT